MLTTLHTLYLSMHGLGWVNLTEADRADPLWEQWPGRCDLVYPLAFEYRLRVHQLIEQAPEDAGLLIVPALESRRSSIGFDMGNLG